MRAAKPSHLLPKFRFPEFEEEAGWSARPLNNVVRSISSGLSLAQTNGSNGARVTRIETIADGTVDINKVGRLTTDDDISSYRIGIGDILFSNINSISHIGKSVLIDREYDLYHGMNLLRIQALSNVIYSPFLYYWLNTEVVRASIRSRANKAVNQASINQTELGKTVVLLPLLAEQKKIAYCLGSLDDLIAAEGQKLEVLRQHKQGLLQQLFLHPGETVPRLRFPEFLDDPWLTPQFADLYGFKRTNTLSRDKLDYKIGTIRNIHYGDIHTKFKTLFRAGDEHVPYVNPDTYAKGFDDDVFLEEGDIVLADASEDLDDVGKAIEVISLDGERVVAGTHTILATRKLSTPVIGFGGHLFQSAVVRAGIKKEAQGAKVFGISANRISAISVPVPAAEAEQQKIGDCLGSLDQLIAAAVRKLEAFRQHKRGLMQQMFPTLEK